jgi:hypothetical protein
MSKMGKFDVDFNPSPAAEYVGLDMYFFNGDGDGPRAGGIQWASERKLRICRAFKEGCELRKMYSVHYNMIYGEKLKKLEIRKAVIRTLAAVMECGILWVQFMAEHVFQSWDRKVLVEAVRRLLDHEETNAIRGREREPFDTKYLDTPDGRREAETLLDLARFLIHNSLPWDSEQSLAAYEAVCIINDTSRSLMFAQIPDWGSNVEVVCATPMALLQGEYSELFRGWTLVKGSPQKEKDDDGAWKWKYHLMGKSRIYGMVAAVDRSDEGGGGSCSHGREVTGVRVYGPVGEVQANHLAVCP